MTLDPSRFDALTFDCYGTLVDWERGLLAALNALLNRHGVRSPGDDALLSLYAELESEAQRGRYRRYREVLAEVCRRIADRIGITLATGEDGLLAESIRDWPAFADTLQALRDLTRRYRLAVLSNIDRDLFALSAPKLGVELDALITAEDVRSYKPGHAHFRRGLEVLGLPCERVLHVAQSRYHDIAPARSLGFVTVWVNRQAGRHGATMPSHAQADIEVPDLATLVSILHGGSLAPRSPPGPLPTILL